MSVFFFGEEGGGLRGVDSFSDIRVSLHSSWFTVLVLDIDIHPTFVADGERVVCAEQLLHGGGAGGRRRGGREGASSPGQAVQAGPRPGVRAGFLALRELLFEGSGGRVEAHHRGSSGGRGSTADERPRVDRGRHFGRTGIRGGVVLSLFFAI